MMKRTHIEDVRDDYDHEVASIVHRVGVDKVVVELTGGGYLAFERVDDPDQHLYEDLSCPDCGTEVYWSEDQLDYVHATENNSKRCWLARNKAD